MCKPLEEYLAAVARSLRPLPVARRDEELREIRHHLQSAATVNQESEQTEAEAVANALEQFGTPDEVGKSIVWAWQRKMRKVFWLASLVQAGLCMFICYLQPDTHMIIRVVCFFVTINIASRLPSLPPKYTPAWLVLERGPLRLIWSRLITACAFVACTVAFFTMPEQPDTYQFPLLWDIIMLFTMWCWRCEDVAKELRQDQENGDGTLGAA